jgi:endonuclease/exonuclease/phosphatase (EEP) superfamily protein YafD
VRVRVKAALIGRRGKPGRVKMILELAAHLLRFAALLVAIAVAVPAVLALGGAVSERADAFAHFAPLYVAGGFLALGLHFATRPERGGLTLVLAGAAILAGLGLMTPDLIAAATARRVAPESQTVKVVQFNLWGRNPDPEGSARWILKEDADIVVLEEAFDNTLIVPQALAEHYPYQTTCSPPFICSTMILSKVAPSQVGGIGREPGASAVAGAWTTFGEGPGAYTVLGVHFARPIPFGLQDKQRRRVSRLMEGFDRPSLILAGDFNSTPWSFSLRRQDALFGLERRTHAIFTWPAAAFSRWRLKSPVPFLAIDQVYAGSAWRTVDVRRGPRLASDHFPVVVTLTRPLAPP